MGHHQVESLAATRPWKRVVGTLGVGAGMAGLPGVEQGSLEAVADATLEASLDGLERAKSDPGLRHVFYLLTQITQAARQEDFATALERLGVRQPAMALALPGIESAAGGTADTIYDLVAHFTNAVDRHIREGRVRSDIGELAQKAAAQSLTNLCEHRSETLFGSTEDSVQDALRRLSTKAGFARLTRDFFARLSGEYLVYHLSRELSNHVGPGRRFESVHEHNEFLGALDSHCRTASSALTDFAGTWYSKHNFEGGITERKAGGFTAHALDKMRDALRHVGGGHAE